MLKKVGRSKLLICSSISCISTKSCSAKAIFRPCTRSALAPRVVMSLIPSLIQNRLVNLRQNDTPSLGKVHELLLRWQVIRPQALHLLFQRQERTRVLLICIINFLVKLLKGLIKVMLHLSTKVFTRQIPGFRGSSWKVVKHCFLRNQVAGV